MLLPSYKAPFFLLLAYASLCLFGCGNSPEERIDAAIAKGTDFLISLQQPSGAISDTANPLFEVWETLVALEALEESGKGQEGPQAKALAYLKASENSAGMLCHNRACQPATCLETTSEYLQFLARTQGPQSIQSQLDSIAHLQQEAGFWDIGNPDVVLNPRYPSVTGFALAALDAGKRKAKQEEWAVLFLNAMGNQGHWASSWEYYGSHAYAFWPILPVLRSRSTEEIAGRLYANTRTWLLDRQGKDGSWDFPLGGDLPQVSKTVHTALALAALQGDSTTQAKAAFSRGCDYLLREQEKDGSWEGGRFPMPKRSYVKEEYVFATAMALRALAEECKRRKP